MKPALRGAALRYTRDSTAAAIYAAEYQHLPHSCDVAVSAADGVAGVCLHSHIVKIFSERA